METSVDQKIINLFEALNCDENIFGWVFNSSKVLLYTNCNEKFLEAGIRQEQLDICLNYGREHNHPLILSTELSCSFCAVFQKHNKTFNIYLLGPILNINYDDKTILSILGKHNADADSQIEILSVINRLPVIPLPRIMHDTILLHYFVNKEKIDRSLIHYHSEEGSMPINDVREKNKRITTYAAEKNLLSMVRDGNLNYKKALTNASNLSNGVGIKSNNNLNQERISVICFTTLCTRAAIEGGLPPDNAYSLSDGYMELISNAKSVTELVSYSHEMYNDFIIHVHKVKALKKYSSQINTIVMYIEFHPKEKISLDYLASLVYYNSSYLSRKFKEETGYNIHDFILKTKLKYAKDDLESGNVRILDIVETYHFSSSNAFSNCFKNEYGILPSEFKNKK